MEEQDLPRYVCGSPVRVFVDVEHERGIKFVQAKFQHETWDRVAINCSGFTKHNLFFKPRFFPRRARVMLTSQQPMMADYSGWYQLEQLKVEDGNKNWHEIDPYPRQRFYVEEKPGRPHETNVRQYKQGEELSLEVEASHEKGVDRVRIQFSGGYGYQQDYIHFSGSGDGSTECRIHLNRRINDSQEPGRYRAYKMEVRPRQTALDRRLNPRPIERTVSLNPPIVFEVVKNEDLTRNTVPKPHNWGFSD
ncbi:MAG: hypothetical protein H0V83_08040 [Rubrobacter sp.]|nr:hypothetical protein [Rubrobacter sp.]